MRKRQKSAGNMKEKRHGGGLVVLAALSLSDGGLPVSVDTAGLASAITFSGPGWWEVDGADGAFGDGGNQWARPGVALE